MFFCVNCNNAYNLTKTVKEKIEEPQTGGKKKKKKEDVDLETAMEEEDQKITGLDDLIDKILNKEIISPESVADLDLESVTKKGKYKKLSTNDKELVTNTLQELMPKKKIYELEDTEKIAHDAFFLCPNCGFYEKIKPKTLIYSKTIDRQDQDILIDDYSDMCNDPTLPRTKSYTCQNKKCITHNKPEKKEAVFFRAHNSFKLIYVCCACETGWGN